MALKTKAPPTKATPIKTPAKPKAMTEKPAVKTGGKSKLGPARKTKRTRDPADVELIVQDVPVGQEMSPFREGAILAGADTTEEGEARLALEREGVHAKKLLEKVKEAREFDKEAYARMAKDRLYAKGINPFRIKVNLIQSYIDLWVAILYARNPSFDASPSEAVSEKNRDLARLFAKTLELVITRIAKRGALKKPAKKWVRSALTVGVGALRATWMERTGKDPIISGEIADIQDQLARLATLQAEMEEGTGPYMDAGLQRTEIDNTLKGLEAKVEKVMERGMAFDFIPLQDITITTEVDSVMDYTDGPWLDIRFFKSVEDAKDLFLEIPGSEIEKCANYKRDPDIPQTEGPVGPATMKQSAKDADNYTYSTVSAGGGDCQFVCIHEFYNRIDGLKYTLIEGLNRYACPPEAPRPYLRRFYDVYLLAFTETDGARWPESLNTRSHTLQDEYSRTRSKFSIHRDRTVPKMLFNSRKMSKTAAKKINGATTAEMVGVDVNANIDMSKLLFVPSYPAIDGALYDTSYTKMDMELIWGTQEAIMGTIQQPKTATEAKIQEGGTMARTTSKRDDLEDVLTEIGEGMAEIALQVFDLEDVRDMAGPEAIWPVDTITPENIDTLLNVEVRAGSSGKPDSQAQIEKWQEEMPILMDGIMEIGRLRNSDPLDVADCIEALIEETVERFGDRLDISRFIPRVPAAPTIDPLSGLMVTQPGMADLAAGAIPGAPIPAGGIPSPIGAPGGPIGAPAPMSEPSKVGPSNVQPLV